MFCQKCGKENKDGSSFCNHCGESLIPIYISEQEEEILPKIDTSKKINEQQDNPPKNNNKIVEFIEYIGWGPFVLIIVGLLMSWIPLGIILLIIGVAWAISKHMNLGDVEGIFFKYLDLGNIEWNVRVTNNNVLKEDDEDEDDEYEDDSTGRGYCIRCGRVIRENPNKPLCEDCYSIWAEYSNPYYPENFCHICRKGSNRSYSKPVCHKCYKKYFK